MNKGRLFTFGCSMTKSFYPTWADILGRNWEYYENWAQSGVGNTFIFSSIIECDYRNHLTPEDTILILWTAMSGRHDYYQDGQWNTKHNAYPDNFNSTESTFNCPTGYEIINYAQICAVHGYLDSKKINYKSMTWYQIDRDSEVAKFYQSTVDKIQYVKFSPNKTYYKPPSDDFPNFLDTATRLYQDLRTDHWPSLDSILNDQYTVEHDYIKKELSDFKQLLNIRKINFEENCQREQQEIDRHPLPTQHLDAVKNTFPDIKLSPDTEHWCENIEKLVLAGMPTNFKTNAPKERF
jgi:hypothetical protein